MRLYFFSILLILILPFSLDAGNLEKGSVSDLLSSDTCGFLNHESGYHFALRSNGLLDLALIPNVTFEFGRGRYSGSATWAAAWWGGGNKCWRIYGGEAAILEKYPGQECFQGIMPECLSDYSHTI